MTKVYIIRHAEAEGNIYRRCHGSYNSKLTPNGVRQLYHLAKRFLDIKLDAVYSSDLTRAFETAKAVCCPNEILRGRCISGKQIIKTPSLREMNLGHWEDMTWGELVTAYADEYTAWESTPWDVAIKDGESMTELAKRMTNAFWKIASDNPDKTVAIVSHGAAIRALLSMLKYNDLHKLNDIGWCDNTAVALIEVDDETPNVIFLNDSSHAGEDSTLEKQKWWRDDEREKYGFNLHFKYAEDSEDIDRAAEYYRKTWNLILKDEFNREYAIETLMYSLKYNRNAISFGYSGEDEIGVIVTDLTSKELRKFGHIVLICLDENYRGKSFGVQFLGEAISQCKRANMRGVTVRVAKTNKNALSFYKKHGFKRAKTIFFDNPTHYVLKLEF